MSFFDTLKADVTKFEGVIVKDEKAVRDFLAGVFGAQQVDTAISQVEAAASTALGKLTKEAVVAVEGALGRVEGSAKSRAVLNIVSAVAGVAGIPFSTGAINTLIELFAPFVQNVIAKEVGLPPSA